MVDDVIGTQGRCMRKIPAASPSPPVHCPDVHVAAVVAEGRVGAVCVAGEGGVGAGGRIGVERVLGAGGYGGGLGDLVGGLQVEQVGAVVLCVVPGVEPAAVPADAGQ